MQHVSEKTFNEVMVVDAATLTNAFKSGEFFRIEAIVRHMPNPQDLAALMLMMDLTMEERVSLAKRLVVIGAAR